MEEYITLRRKYLSILVNGLTNSKTKCGDKWTPKDERDLDILKSRKKEIDAAHDCMREGSKSKEYVIEKLNKKIERLSKDEN